MADYYIGLISGTSMDAIDAVLAKFERSSVDVLQTHKYRYPTDLHDALLSVISDPGQCTLDDFGALDRRVGNSFRDAAIDLLDDAGIDASEVVAIGSHGQTLRHQPDAADPYTIQIGDASVIAKGTGITTVADFRRGDLALGGQGAPLTPPFHEWLFRRSDASCVVLNIGGIANVTILPAGGSDVTGFDTGPGNTLLDAWIREQRRKPFDRDGRWAATGKVQRKLLARLLADPYFSAQPPKSTGFEYFNLGWVGDAGGNDYQPADVQATLASLTATSIASAILKHAPGTTEVLVCGGGVHNRDLLRRLAADLPGATISSTAARGLDPDWVEAAAFAWLAMRALKHLPGNLPSVTGASRAAVLGAIYPPQ